MTVEASVLCMGNSCKKGCSSGISVVVVFCVVGLGVVVVVVVVVELVVLGVVLLVVVVLVVVVLGVVVLVVLVVVLVGGLVDEVLVLVLSLVGSTLLGLGWLVVLQQRHQPYEWYYMDSYDVTLWLRHTVIRFG